MLRLHGRVDGDRFAQRFPRQTKALFEGILPERFDCDVDADGTFVLEDMPPDPLIILAAEGEGLAHAQWGNTLVLGRRIPESMPRLVTVEEQKAATGFRVALEKGVRVGGVVREYPGNQPVPDAVIMAIGAPPEGIPLATCRSDGQGRYAMLLPTGSVLLFFNSVPEGLVQPESFPYMGDRRPGR